ncbi:MAG: hypothetical protein ACLQPD_23105 [Desulfomonilaceae bacterium]
MNRAEVKSMLKEQEAKLTRLIDEKIQAALGKRPADMTAGEKNDPPLPPKSGKKFAGAKGDLRVRIDSNLLGLLESDCNRHYNGNMSRCLDAILWRYYREPALSFEEPQTSDSEPTAETDA